MEKNFNAARSFKIFCTNLSSIHASKNLIIEASYNTIDFSSNTIIFDGLVDLSLSRVVCNNINISNISEIVTKFLKVNTLTLPSNVELRYNSVNNGYIRNTGVGYNLDGIGRSDAYFTYINVSGGDSSFNDSLYINKNLLVDGIITINNDLLINGTNFETIDASFSNYKARLEQNFYSAKITTKDVSALNISISNELVVNKTAFINYLTLSGQLLNSVLKVPSIFTIDPSGYNNSSGSLFINGNLTVLGAITTLSSSNIDICDAAITLASKLANRLDLISANAGLDISNIASLKYNGTTWNFSGGQLTVGNNNILFDVSLISAKDAIDLSFNALNADFSSSFFTLKRNIDNSFNDTYNRFQIDNSFILKSAIDVSLNSLQSYLDNSYVSKMQLDASFNDLKTLMDVSYVEKNSILSNPFDTSFASFNTKLDISYVLNSVFEASYNSLKTAFEVSFGAINVNNIDVSSIIIDTINTRHSSQMFTNTLWNQLGLDISNGPPLINNNKKVAMSNDGKVVALSSSTYYLSNATDVGIVYVYELSYNNWNRLGNNAIVGISGDELGYSLALSSNGRIVAASSLYNDTSGNNCGQVRVYELSNNLWINRGNIINGRNITNYQSGYSLNMSGNGNLISISSLKGTTDLSYGEVRLYELSSNNIWIQKGRDISGTVSGASEGYSTSLSLDGTTLAIGCDVSINNIGQVKIFRFTNDWNSIGTIQGPQQYLTDISARSTIIQLGVMINNGETPLEIAINFNGSILAYPNDANTLILIFKYTDQEWTLVNNVWKYNFKGWLKLASPSLSGIQSIGYPNLSYGGTILSHAGRSNNINFIVVLRYNDVSWNEIYRITGLDFISALSGDGKVIAVTNSLSGNGYVSVYKYVSDLSWTQTGLNITGTASITAFATGIALSVSGDFIVCSTRNYLSNTGIARVYRYNTPVASNWNLIGDIVGPVAGQSFGWVKASMSSNGQTIAIGSYGYIYVYKYISDMSWIQIGAIQGNSNYYYFPSLSSDGTVVGLSKGGSKQTTGDIPYLGNKITQIWKYIQSRWIQISDKSSVGASNLLGFDLAGDGNSFVVSNQYNGTYVYKYIDTTIVRRYSDLSFITNKDKYLNLFFGRDVKLSSTGNRIVIGATGPIGPVFDDPSYNMNPSSVYRYNQGSIWAYEYQGTGTTWTQLGQSIHGITGGDEFGSSVSMSNDGTIISAGSNNYSSNRGQVRVFGYANNYWHQVSNAIDGKTLSSKAGIHALAGDGTTLIQSNNTYNSVYGINKNLVFVAPSTAINTTISGDLVVTGKAILKSLKISNKFAFDTSGAGYSSNYLATTDISSSIVDYYSNVGYTYNKVFKIDACGNISNYSGVYGSISDSRLKENIVTSAPKLEDMLKVRVVNYRLKGSDQSKYIGLLAQELEELFPELVLEDNSNEKFKSINYSSLTIMLIKALQEQQVLINNLITTLEDMEKKIII